MQQNPSVKIDDDHIHSKINDIEQEMKNVANKCTNIEQPTSNLRQEVLMEVEAQEEMKNMNKRYEALSIRYPLSTTASKPTVTFIPNIQVPQTMAYQLASKTANVKTLSKELYAITFQNDDVKTIVTTYSRIAQAFDITCGTVSLLPALAAKRIVPDFYKELVPQSDSHAFFTSIFNGYKAISNSLYDFIIKINQS